MDWLFQLSLLIYFSWFWSHVSSLRSVRPFESLFFGVALKCINSFVSYRSLLALLSSCLACLSEGTRSRALERACKGGILRSRYRSDFHRSSICSCIILAHSCLGDTCTALSTNNRLVESLAEFTLLSSLTTLCAALRGRGRDWTSISSSLSCILSFLILIISMRLSLRLSLMYSLRQLLCLCLTLSLGLCLRCLFSRRRSMRSREFLVFSLLCIDSIGFIHSCSQLLVWSLLTSSLRLHRTGILTSRSLTLLSWLQVALNLNWLVGAESFQVLAPSLIIVTR